MFNWRTVAAIVAIYAIAVQGVLVLTAPGRAATIAAAAGVLCKAGESGTTDTAHVDDFCAKCLAGHCAAALGGRATATFVSPERAVARGLAHWSAAHAFAWPGQNLARAPPAA